MTPQRLRASAVACLALLATACSVTRGSADHPASPAPDTVISVQAYPGLEAALPRQYPTPNPGTSFTIGFLNPVAGNENLQAVQRAAQAETAKLGGRMVVKDDQDDVATQLRDFNELLAQGVDAIIVYPLDPKALGPSLAAARQKGVPVIGYDVTNTAGPDLPSGYTSQILQGRDWQAWLMATAMAKAKPGGQIGLIGISAPVPGIEYLMQRLSYWADRSGLHTVDHIDNNQGDTASGGQAAATALLGAHPKLDGIIAFNDPSAVGTASAAAIAARSITIVGNNGDSNGINGVRSGKLFATFQNDAVGQGIQGVIAAYDALQHQQIPPTIIRPPLIAITSATLGTVRSWEQQLAGP